MKRSLRILILLILSQLSLTLFSVDLYTYFEADNFHFNDSNDISNSHYDFNYGEIITQEISDGLFLDAGFTKSIVNDYSIYTDFKITNDLFGFNLGIFTNFLNDSGKLLTPGLNYGLNFKVPGLLLVSLDINNTIPNTSPLESGVNINNYDISVGFYMGDAILSFNLESSNNSKGTILTSNSTSYNKYFMNLDLFNKYTTYRISIDLGWNYIYREITTLSITDNVLSGDTSESLKAGSAFFNTEFTLMITDNLSLDIGMLLHLYKIPISGLELFSTDEFSWSSNIGLLIRL